MNGHYRQTVRETRSFACKFVLPTIKSLHMCPIRLIVVINKKLKFYSPSEMNKKRLNILKGNNKPYAIQWLTERG